MEKSPTKICSKCKKPKPATEFYKDKRATDGLYSSCRICFLALRQKEPGKLDHMRYEKPEEPEGYRWCSKCKEIKPVDTFQLYHRKGKNPILRRECTECKLNASKVYVENNQDRINQYNLDNRDVLLAKKRQYHLKHRKEHL